VRLDQIVVPPEVAVLRNDLSQDHVEQMAIALQEGRDLPRICLALDSQGRYNRLTGGHRIEAHRQAGHKWIDADIYEDLPRRKWLAFALEDNRENALPLSRAERKAAAQKLIETTDMPDTDIARLCGFDRHTVGEWRRGGHVAGLPHHPPGDSTPPGDSRGRPWRRGEAKAQVRAYEEANPEASKAQVSKETGASESTVKRRRRLARSGESTETSAPNTIAPKPSRRSGNSWYGKDVHGVLEALRPVSDKCQKLLPGLPETVKVAEIEVSRFLGYLKPLNEMAGRLRGQEEGTTT
jgi:hypothetical protein